MDGYTEYPIVRLKADEGRMMPPRWGRVVKTIAPDDRCVIVNHRGGFPEGTYEQHEIELLYYTSACTDDT